MKTLSESDWQDIHSAFKNNQHSLNSEYFTIEGIQKQIENKQVGESVYYAQQNAPFELGEDGRPKPQFDENGESIPLFYVNECIIIEK